MTIIFAQHKCMVPGSDDVITVRLETNEMIERERFSALLQSMEEAVRSNEAGGASAILLVGGVRRGSIDLVVAIVGTVMATGLAIPSFIVSLKQLAGDKRQEPNSFAVALGEIMVTDAVQRVDFTHRDRLVSITRNEVPYVRRLGFDEPVIQTKSLRSMEAWPREEPRDEGLGIEDEDQDWIPTLEASEAPPREANAGPVGFISALTLVGDFVLADRGAETRELHFIPRDSILASYFVVASAAYDAEPAEKVEYKVTGNISLDPTGINTIEVLSIESVEDGYQPTRS